MNGSEHYAEAERLLAVADSRTGAALLADGINCTALAQVHATLALTAATAYRYASPANAAGAWGEAIHGPQAEPPNPWRADQP